ncbi:hypothetical protein SISSUDRAFT_1125716 [Sistotremastrum suecicum HHB10207 ss-3]|uniref:Uncharacterized protein n=1 Tax=Sistotremastrum suecicum HHB10207 ss-3 TaxID=1314776 RepID=A0A166H2Y7_9AGAM|nr:hypothetical protein SISSUDRAFT_1125716 [Sistotremastrum suecicum HHB10207 ss-3]
MLTNIHWAKYSKFWITGWHVGTRPLIIQSLGFYNATMHAPISVGFVCRRCSMGISTLWGSQPLLLFIRMEPAVASDKLVLTTSDTPTQSRKPDLRKAQQAYKTKKNETFTAVQDALKERGIKSRSLPDVLNQAALLIRQDAETLKEKENELTEMAQQRDDAIAKLLNLYERTADAQLHHFLNSAVQTHAIPDHHLPLVPSSSHFSHMQRTGFEIPQESTQFHNTNTFANDMCTPTPIYRTSETLVNWHTQN